MNREKTYKPMVDEKISSIDICINSMFHLAKIKSYDEVKEQALEIITLIAQLDTLDNLRRGWTP